MGGAAVYIGAFQLRENRFAFLESHDTNVQTFILIIHSPYDIGHRCNGGVGGSAEEVG